MNRYERVMDISTIKFGKKIPIYVEKGAILDDLSSGRNYLQLKLVNTGKKCIKNLSIRFLCKTYTDSSEELIELKLTDVMAGSMTSFGTKNIILLPVNFKSIRFSEIIIVYEDDEEESFGSKRYINISLSKSSNKNKFVCYMAAFFLFLYVIIYVIWSRGFHVIHGFYSLIILSLVFKRKNKYLSISIGATGIYLLIYLLLYMIMDMRYVSYNLMKYFAYDWRIIVPDIILVVIYLLMCFFAKKEDKSSLRKLWFLPGILEIIELLIGYGGVLSYYPNIYKIILVVHLLSTFMIGYCVCQDD